MLSTPATRRRPWTLWLAAILLALSWGGPPPLAAAGFSGADIEKPKPEFTRSGDEISARFIPRAKSGRVTVRFKTTGGRLVEVIGVDFESAERPEVDVKNFKSALFDIRVDGLPKGGEAQIALISDFFTRSTAFYVFNAALEKPWMIPAIENISHPDRVQELVVTVRDGGPLDADNSADGRVSLVGGPRDSFWGYALGTLFIRFFGIFIVLAVLMLGLVVSGLVFKRLGPKPPAGAAPPPGDGAVGGLQAAPAAAEASADTAAEEQAAAIAVALHLHLTARRPPGAAAPGVPGTAAWVADGRSRLMKDRLEVFNHPPVKR